MFLLGEHSITDGRKMQVKAAEKREIRKVLKKSGKK